MAELVQVAKQAACTFEDIGCSFKGSETELKTHINTAVADHLEMLMKTVTSVDLQEAQQQKKLQTLTAEKNYLAETLAPIQTAQTNLKTQIQQLAESDQKMHESLDVLTAKLDQLVASQPGN